jgi:hypothetical protein
MRLFLKKNILKIRKKNAIKHNNTWRFLSVKRHFLLMLLNIFKRHVLQVLFEVFFNVSFNAF